LHRLAYYKFFAGRINFEKLIQFEKNLEKKEKFKRGIHKGEPPYDKYQNENI